MDKKAELKSICFKWVWKAFETGTKQDPFSVDNSEYWHPAIDLKWSKEMAEELEQYASEVSREQTVKFINYLIDSDISIDLSTNTLELFDKWKPNQEDKPGNGDGQTFSPRI